MSFLVAIAALVFLMVAAYRGHSVILFAPIAAMGAVLLTDPSAVAPVFTGLFMERMAGFVKLYFPVFLLGAIFGKLIEALRIRARHRRAVPLRFSAGTARCWRSFSSRRS